MIDSINQVGRFVKVDWDYVGRVGSENVGPVIPGDLILLRVNKIGGMISPTGALWVLVETVTYIKLYIWLPGDILVESVLKGGRENLGKRG